MGTSRGSNNSNVSFYASSSTSLKSNDDSDLRDGIAELLSRWSGLQMAVLNQWGGGDSLQKSQQLASDILFLFSQSQAFSFEDIENLLHESLLLSFNTEIEDGSIEKVAEELMVMHEDRLHGNHEEKSRRN